MQITGKTPDLFVLGMKNQNLLLKNQKSLPLQSSID